jgi:hypothetical protein
MSDLDTEINNLESEVSLTSSSPEKSGSGQSKRWLFLSGGSLAGGVGLTFLIKPMWAYSQEVDRRTGELQTKIRWSRYLLSVLIFAALTFFSLNKLL